MPLFLQAASPGADPAGSAAPQRTSDIGSPRGHSAALDGAPGREPRIDVGGVNDPAEQEAERFAAFALDEAPLPPGRSTGAPAALRRKCAACEEGQKCTACEEEERSGDVLRRAADPSAGGGSPAAQAGGAGAGRVADVLASPGAPLPDSVRSWLEPMAGVDLAPVRVHTDGAAGASARALGARAWSYSGHIAFGEGEWSPDTLRGKRLLAHEVGHFVQGVDNQLRRSAVPGEPSPAPLGETPGSGGGGPAPPTAAAVPQRSTSAHRPDACPPPPTMPCAPALSSPAGVTNTLLFPVDSAVLTPLQKVEIDAVAASFHSRGGWVTLRVDGYASVDGPCGHNWSLSCARARAVAAELSTPSDGSMGVPTSNLAVFANGESADGGPSLAANRRATIAAPLPPPPVPVPPTPAGPCPAPPGPAFPVLLGRARGCGGGPDFAYFDFPSISFSSSLKLQAWAKLHRLAFSRSMVTNLECEVEMAGVLGGLAGSAGLAAFSRFAAGAGGTATHGPGSLLGSLALASGSFRRTRTRVATAIESQLRAQAAAGSVDPAALSVTPPATHFEPSDGWTLKAVIGGTQGEELSATGFTCDPSTRTYTIDLEYRICDDFGVSESDLYAPGLFAFWVLQHERSGYVPFINELVLNVTETGSF